MSEHLHAAFLQCILQIATRNSTNSTIWKPYLCDKEDSESEQFDSTDLSPFWHILFETEVSNYFQNFISIFFLRNRGISLYWLSVIQI